MDKAYIYPVYDFIGYRLCEMMLENGMEVIGVRDEQNLESGLIEEKRLEIGRNANFNEVSSEALTFQNQKEMFIVSLLDLFEKDGKLNKSRLTSIGKLFKNFHHTHLKLIIILPALAAHETKDQREWLSFLNLKEKKNLSVLELYLPTIFGPWQPSQYFFHQCLSRAVNLGMIPDVPECEWTEDAIFIDDASEIIVQIIEREEAGRFLLSSGEKRRWHKCVEWLLIGEKENYVLNLREGQEISDEVQIKYLDKNMDYKQGLELQKEHFLRIQKDLSE